jgi:ferric iron reductase protein FhuF
MMFEGALVGFGRTRVIDGERPVLPLTELLRDEVLEGLLLRAYGAELVRDQLPVLASQWMKYYAMQLIPPVVVASLVHGVSWPLSLDCLGFAVDERGVLDGVRFDGAACALAPAGEPFAPLLENLRQVIDRLSAYANVPAAVLWCTAGDYLETCLRELAAVSDVCLAPGHALLKEKLTPSGLRNPLFNAIRYTAQADGQSLRQRRSCCLSYRVAWVGRCEHCPLQP